MSSEAYDSEAWVIARDKFSAIAPVINKTFGDKSIYAYFKRMDGTPMTFEDGQVRLLKASTMADWYRKYKNGGLEALLPVKRNDKGMVRCIDIDTLANFAQRVSEKPNTPVTVIYEQMIEEGIITPADVSVSTLQRYARKLKQQNDVVTKHRLAFEAEHVNGIWQADTLYGPYISDNGSRRRAYLQSIIDDKSRLIVGSRFTLSDDTASFMNLFKDAVCTYGVPAKLYVDNGGAYRNVQLATVCAQIGTVLSHAPVRDGAAKGKIERLNRTIRMRYLPTIPDDCAMTLDELNESLTAWVTTYNTTLHSTINCKPIDRWANEATSIRRISPEKAEELFRFRVKRKVRNDSTILLNNLSFEIPLGHTGESCTIMYVPDYSQAWVIFEGEEPVRIYRTDKVANTHRPRLDTRYRIDYSSEN